MSVPSESNEQTSRDSSPRAAAGPESDWTPYGDSPYLLGAHLASGGMGSIHLALKQGALGFRRLLAIKRLHPHLAQDPDFVSRFVDEIRLVSRLDHPNVVQTFDVLETQGELALVMEYVHGITLHQLQKRVSAAGDQLPIAVAAASVAQALHGLHSAHELCDDAGGALHLVHRDVSPQNIMLGRDGLVKVLDFGVAKAASELHVTRTGQISGKPAYMAPEQVAGLPLDRRTDIFSAGIVLWEALTGQRLFRPRGAPEATALRNIMALGVRPPSELRSEVGPALERIVMRALEREPTRRFGSARDFALALEEAVPEASASAIASAVAHYYRADLARERVASLPTSPKLNANPRPLRPESAETLGAPVELAPSTSTSETTPSGPGRNTHHTTSAMHSIAFDAAFARPRRTRRLVWGLSIAAALGAVAFVVTHTPLRSTPEGGVASTSRGALQPLADATSSASAAAAAVATTQTSNAGGAHPDHDTLALEREQPSGAHPSRAVHPSRKTQLDGEVRASGTATPKRRATPARGEATPQRTATPEAPAAPKPTEALEATSSPTDTADPVTTRNEATPQRHAAAAPKPRATSPPRRARAKSAAARTKPSARTSAHCSPPTYTDADGIRHFKPECL